MLYRNTHILSLLYAQTHIHTLSPTLTPTRSLKQPYTHTHTHTHRHDPPLPRRRPPPLDLRPRRREHHPTGTVPRTARLTSLQYLEARYKLAPSLIAAGQCCSVRNKEVSAGRDATQTGFPLVARGDLFWPEIKSTQPPVFDLTACVGTLRATTNTSTFGLVHCVYGLMTVTATRWSRRSGIPFSTSPPGSPLSRPTHLILPLARCGCLLASGRMPGMDSA
jgi:hypothetical protein